MKDFFKPLDFGVYTNCDPLYPEDAAKYANEKLNAEIEKWPVVYMYKGEWFFEPFKMHNNDGVCTHKARLAFIEEIKNKIDLPKHLQKNFGEENNNLRTNPDPIFICNSCGEEKRTVCHHDICYQCQCNCAEYCYLD